MYFMYEPNLLELEKQVLEAASFEALAEIAKKNLCDQVLDQQVPCTIVCGPMTSGGTGNQIHNFEIFNAAIRELQERGENIFNQLPYEHGLHRLVRVWKAEGNIGYCMPILETFYATLFESGHINHGKFLPGWESSVGASYERQKLGAHGIHISDITHEHVRDLLYAEHSPEHAEEIMLSLQGCAERKFIICKK